MNALEDRLSAALNARAEQVAAPDLAAPSVPATVTPLHRRTRPALYAVAAAAAVAVAVTAVAVNTSGGTDSPGQATSPSVTVTDTSSPDPAPTPEQPPTTKTAGERLAAKFAEASTREVPIGTTITYSDGTTATLEPAPGAGPDVGKDGGVEDGQVQLVVEHDGTEQRADVPGGSTPSLVRVELQLGQAGSGYLVRQEGGDSDVLRLFVPTDAALVAATVTGDVPFGGGFLPSDYRSYRTYVAADEQGFFTQVQTAPGADSYDIYYWEVTGPGEGGGPGAVDHLDRNLVSRSEGTYCIDLRKNTYRHC